MTKRIFKTLIATTALASAMPVFAQAPAAEEAPAAEAVEIVVTARRTNEKLQNVPVSVQAVSGSQLSKLSITSADELGKIAPGLKLENQGASSSVVLRGVTWQPGSGTAATPIYMNEIGFDPANSIASLFDIGQIEVLRGPQGTSRGAPSISGAITITPVKPNLNRFGGFVQGLYGSGKHSDIQAALNLPIIKDVLALRLATNIEDSEGNRVTSVNSTIKPKFQDRSYRATLLFKPTDDISLQAMYQRRINKTRFFTQVAGAGAVLVGGTVRNGPALTVAQNKSVQDAPSTTNEKVDLFTVNASWVIGGQKLSYNFGKQYSRSGPSFSTADPLNILPGFEPYTSPANRGLPKFTIHEIRLSSTPGGDLPFDYNIGYYSKRSRGIIDFTAPVYYLGALGGAFGAPAVPGAVTTPNPAYVLNSSTAIDIGQEFSSLYGDLRFQLSDKTELTGGIAIVKDRVISNLFVTTAAARLVAAPLAAFAPAPACSFVPGFAASLYPGFCDRLIPAGFGNSTELHDDKYSAVLYNFSLSHKFSDKVLGYITHGSSFRTGLPAINNTGLPTALTVPNPETAKSYELGLKTTLGRRTFLNVALFQLDYKDKLTTFEGVNYFSNIPGVGIKQTSLAFYRNVDSRVRGFEVEFSAQPTDALTLGVNMSYSKIKGKGGLVPCNNAAIALTAANPINSCASAAGEVLNTTAPFQVTANGNYTIPVGDSLNGYLRFNLNYQGNNPNFGNFKTGAAFKQVSAYAVLDLFAGLTAKDSSWNLGVYAKNIFDKQVENARVLTGNSIYAPFGPGGYDVVRTSPPREIGVTLRYAFGSR